MANNTGTALVRAFSPSHAHSGWSAAEDALLWDEVKKARQAGRPLKSVFDTVAQTTGRKPNSIRNYYYARAREDPSQGHSPAFVPFTQEEIWDLLLKVLGAQARGMSVRACTLELGGGDTRAMLRYQNKYRALLKNNPALVQEAVRYMQSHDLPCKDPFDRPRRKEREPARPQEAAPLQTAPAFLRLAGEMQETRRRLDALEQAVRALEAGSPALAPLPSAL